MDVFTGILQFAVAIIALIVLHEFGHFIVARLLKVEVEEFGLGIPPRVTVLFKVWGTKFTLNWLPLGGFVRPKGENDPSVPGGLAAARPSVRLAVLVAGPLMNLLLGVLLYTVIFIRTGMPDTTRVKVLDVAENSPAAELGIQPGDLIVQVNGQGAKSQQDFLDAIYSNLGKVVTITYQRGDATYEGSLVPRPNPPQGQGAIGIVMGYAMLPVSVPQAVSSGVVAVYQDCRNILMLPVRILRREINPDAGRLVGYRGMFNLYQDARQGEIIPGLPADISILLFFTQITISLGLLNLLPFPALDGGRILFVLPELVLRRRVPQQFENVVNLVGITILILLMLYINLQEWI